MDPADRFLAHMTLEYRDEGDRSPLPVLDGPVELPIRVVSLLVGAARRDFVLGVTFCPACNGSGEFPVDGGYSRECEACDGSGATKVLPPVETKNEREPDDAYQGTPGTTMSWHQQGTSRSPDATDDQLRAHLVAVHDETGLPDDRDSLDRAHTAAHAHTGGSVEGGSHVKAFLIVGKDGMGGDTGGPGISTGSPSGAIGTGFAPIDRGGIVRGAHRRPLVPRRRGRRAIPHVTADEVGADIKSELRLARQVDARTAALLGARYRKVEAWRTTMQNLVATHFDRQHRVLAAKLGSKKVRDAQTKAATPTARRLVAAGVLEKAFDKPMWAAQLAADARAVLNAQYDDFGTDEATRFGTTFAVDHPRVQTMIGRQIARLALIEDTTYNELATALNPSPSGPETKDDDPGDDSDTDVADALDAVFGRAADTRAPIIGLTETHAAANGAALAAGEQAVGDNGYKIWQSMRDSAVRTSPPGEFDHDEADGEEVPLGQPFVMTGEPMMYPGDPDGSPGNFINCVAPWVRVSGFATAAMKFPDRHHDLVHVVTAGGNQIAATSDHPVLTRFGWRSIGALQPGDEVLCTAQSGASAVSGPDVADGEPTAEQAFAAAALWAGGAKGVAFLGVDLDGYMADTEVEVKWPDDPLSLGGHAQQLEQLGKLTVPVPHGEVRLADHPSAGLRAVHSDYRRLMRISQSDTHIEQAVNDDVTADSETFSDGLLGQQFVLIESADISVKAFAATGGRRSAGDAEIIEARSDLVIAHSKPSSQVGGGNTLQIEAPNLVANTSTLGRPAFPVFVPDGFRFDTVIDISRRSHLGSVYDFETPAGFYAAGGVVSHNCRCFLVVNPSGEKRRRFHIKTRHRYIQVKYDEDQERDEHGRWTGGDQEPLFHEGPSWGDAQQIVADANKGTPYGTKDPATHAASTTTDHPRYFFHTSKTANRESIQASGLEAGRSLGGRNTRVYVAADRPTMEARSDTAPRDLWRVDTQGVPLRPDPELPDQWAISGHDFGADRIELVDTSHPDGLPSATKVRLSRRGHVIVGDRKEQPRDDRGRFAGGGGATAPPELFHGTTAQLQPGDVIEPVAIGGHAPLVSDAPFYDPGRVYLSDQSHLAGRYAYMRAARTDSTPHVYQVRPAGAVGRDPEYTYSGFGADQWVAERAEVVREVDKDDPEHPWGSPKREPGSPYWEDQRTRVIGGKGFVRADQPRDEHGRFEGNGGGVPTHTEDGDEIPAAVREYQRAAIEDRSAVMTEAEAQAAGMEGPFYHGTTGEAAAAMQHEGFRVPPLEDFEMEDPGTWEEVDHGVLAPRVWMTDYPAEAAGYASPIGGRVVTIYAKPGKTEERDADFTGEPSRVAYDVRDVAVIKDGITTKRLVGAKARVVRFVGGRSVKSYSPTQDRASDGRFGTTAGDHPAKPVATADPHATDKLVATARGTRDTARGARDGPEPHTPGRQATAPKVNLANLFAYSPHDQIGTHGFCDQKELTRIQRLAIDKIKAAPKPTQDDIDRNRRSVETSKRAGGEFRGNSHDRDVRAGKLVAEFEAPHQPGVAHCVYCGGEVTKDTVSQDKIWVATQGGRYRMGNLLPACVPCNEHRNDTPIVGEVAGRQAKTYDPDQPRDDSGRWGEGDSSAPTEVSGTDFHQAISAAAAGGGRGGFLSVYTPAEYVQMRCFIANDGKTGGALKDHGDGRTEIVSLFNNGGPRGAGSAMLDHLISEGGNYLECYGDFLRDSYAQHGFVLEQSAPFDPVEAKPGWDYARDGTPDYNTMRLQ